MGTALWKDFFREIRRSFNRFISIFAIVFIGVAFFVGVKATTPDMKHSMNLYYDEYNLMDIRIMATLGITDDDIKAIGAIDGVYDVQPGYFTDVVTTVNSTELVLKVHSLPTRIMSSTGEYGINRLKLTEGRFPERSGECIVEDSPFMDWGISVGDTIKVGSGKSTAITDGTLYTDVYKVVGKARTPYYLSYEKGASEIGSGKANFFMMIPDYDFRIPVYTEALVTVKNARELNSYSKDYEKLISRVVTSLENLGVDRSGLRLDEIKKAAMEELDKAKAEYNEKKQQFDEEMKKAEDQLSQAQMDLAAGEAQLETEKKNFQLNYDQASRQIQQGEKDLAEGEKEYQQSLAEYNQLKADYGENIDNLNQASQELTNQRQQAKEQIAALNEMLNDPNLTEEQRQSTQQLITMYETFLASTDEASDSIGDANNLAQDQTKTAEEQLKRARKKLDESAAELAAAKRKLAASKREADAKFTAARAELDAGWEEYNKNKAEYEKQKAEGEKQLEDAREKIIRAEDEIEKLSKPQWYVLGRNSHYSYVDYGKTADRIDAIAKIFPVFFFLVATLVCLTTMTRMIDEQRGNIGAYKALGYNNMAIALKYLLYAAIASLLGGVLGALLGMKVFPEIIYKSWSMMYTLPPLRVVQQVPLVVVSVLFGILVTALSALGACYRELKETPALLMRPKAPKMGKKILMERIHIIWKRLSFS
jgi:putative ABC transport system permease protein